jgi:hypothetical protein
MKHPLGLATVAALLTASLSACGGGNDEAPLPRLSAATGAALQGSCTDLSSRLSYADTTITSVTAVAAGTLKVAGNDIPAHCQVTGSMFPRVGPVDGKNYAIGFELRLPLNWNGRFFYQANGGIDGNVVTAQGPVGGGSPLNNALNMGFAVISSDAGHAGSLGPFFGIDPQARLDYGYQAVAKLTPMAKGLIQSAYGKAPDRSYIGGCSNGGRHTMVAASRLGDQYDGFLVGNPGYRLPLAAIANMAGAQAYVKLATDPSNLGTAFTQAERTLVSNAVLAKCDALDGAVDGVVQDTTACQAAFNLERDVPTCSGARDGSCLSTAQKTTIAQLFAGATTSTGARIYSSFPFDAGLGTGGWAVWKFTNSLALDPGAVGLIWSVPPEDPATFNGRSFALNTSVDTMLAKVNATNSLYTESAMSFMTPPNSSDMGTVKHRGAKILAYHGTSDPIFSSDDTQSWYSALDRFHGGSAARFARYFPVPGMNHCSGGPATDQFDMLSPLVAWVENGVAPDSVTATARGTGNVGGVNADVPSSWAANRTRPLCPFPKVARYKGSGSLESADSFECR